MEKNNLDLFSASLSGDRIDRLGNNLTIIENPGKNGQTDFPFRSGTTVSIVVLKGHMACIVDMEVHSISVPGMLVILPSQTVEKISFSEEFSGYCMIMSPSFLDNLPIRCSATSGSTDSILWTEGRLTHLSRISEWCRQPSGFRTITGMK